MAVTMNNCDRDEIIRLARLVMQPGQVTEVRMIGAQRPSFRKNHTEYGYFDDPDKLADAVSQIERAQGVYFIPNPVNPALLARAENRLKPFNRGDAATSDHDIDARHWLPIDCDPVRPSGISSTAEEHDAAVERAKEVREYLRSNGWAEPILADSGNGAHLMHRIDLPVDDGGLVKRCLEVLDARFSDESVKIDVVNHNPARIWKLPGTMVRKGDSTADRPHRMAQILDAPEQPEVVPVELLRELVEFEAEGAPEEGVPDGETPKSGEVFEIQAWIDKHGLGVDGPTPWNDGGRRWVFRECPWNPDHTNGSAFIVQHSGGAVAAGCHHNGCDGKDWHALRDLVEPGWREGVAASADLADHADRSAGEKRKTQAVLLVELASDADLFHTPGGYDSQSFATIRIGRHRETWAIRSRAFKAWLVRRFYEKYEKIPHQNAVADALLTISGKAIFDGAEHEVFVRLAEHNGAIYLDLADEDWRAVRIDADGWRVVDSSDLPVRFVRKRGEMALPTPVAGGSISALYPFVNVADHSDWALLVAWLVAALRPNFPFPILAVNGEQGSAKSTLCRYVRALIDPNQAPLRRPPKSEEDLMIAANNGWVMAYDNLSGISGSMSDSLCVVATGGGLAKRQLYTDDDEILLDAKRPVMVNGIDDLGTRSDLLDRMIRLTLPKIPSDARRSEKALRTAFEEARPRILGALLDAVSTGIRNLSRVEIPDLPRMADFAEWVVAAEPALPWEPGSFLAAYTGNRDQADALAIESSPIGAPIRGLMHGRANWRGTMRELLVELDHHHADEQTRRRKDWPVNAKALGSALRRIAPNLRNEGIDAQFHAPSGHNKERIVELTNLRIQRSARSARSASQPGLPFGGDRDETPHTASSEGARLQGSGIDERPSLQSQPSEEVASDDGWGEVP